MVSGLLAVLGLVGLAYGAWSLVADVRLATRAAYGSIGLWFGASALLSAIGLGRMRRWALRPLASWVLACLAAPWVPYLVAVEAESSIDGIAGSVVMAVATVPVWLAARRALRPHSPTPPGAG